MKFIEIRRNSDGLFLNPEKYLEQLSSLGAALPSGAWDFASDPGHYDFRGARCVKDLNLKDVSHTGENEVTISFGPNQFKHDEGLFIVYVDVSRIDFRIDGQGYFYDGFSPVVLDEVLPTESGCSHEIALINGSMLIECADLRARWLALSDHNASDT
ncbi:hypothetical protein ACQPZ2_32885 [Nocardia pseudovaccinii]|uniref:hypothetical protein n=1 Tax=Nocardia pseudovaccinii TaxID=189540 RepID=UPI003D94EEA1